MKEQHTLDSTGHLLLKTVFTWEKGPDDASRLTRTESTDELGQTLATAYDEYGTNNSFGRIREYDYDGATVVRTTLNTYVSYLDNDLDQGISTELQSPYPLFHPRLVNVVGTAKIFSGDDSANKLNSYVQFKYDEYAAPLKAYTPDY